MRVLDGYDTKNIFVNFLSAKKFLILLVQLYKKLQKNQVLLCDTSIDAAKVIRKWSWKGPKTKKEWDIKKEKKKDWTTIAKEKRFVIFIRKKFLQFLKKT